MKKFGNANVRRAWLPGMTGIILALCLPFIFIVACGGGEDEDKHTHDWDMENPELITEATCVEPGVEIITCLTCGETQERSTPIDSTNHHWGPVTAVAFEGSTKKCLDCNTSSLFRNMIHFINAWTIPYSRWPTDAILLESNGKYGLIDAGLPGHEDYIINYLQRLQNPTDGKVRLDFILSTHPDDDHIGGFVGGNTQYPNSTTNVGPFPGLISKTNVTIGRAYLKEGFDIGTTHENQDHAKMISQCRGRNIPVIYSRNGMEITLGEMKVTFLNANDVKNDPTNYNGGSMCQLVEVGAFKALLMADLQGPQGGVHGAGETSVVDHLKSKNITKAQLLKVGHHGNMGHTVDFLNQIKTDFAVYTNRTDNTTFPSGGAQITDSGATGVNRLKTANSNVKQYVTRDSGGVLAVINESSGAPTLFAIKEYIKEPGKPEFEVRATAKLTPAPGAGHE
jgi:beta-lactamase superfamily II metal-dependent hydrolase